ncbi:hypothetical protein [Flavobacterium sp. 140616W15]|uniref:hypothetical protein n=1 Tax=Flavobacterium sp. 140616W15 TaxID=2478552 RepID=UPI000F0C95F8|nr:hypothetical protein [Flavobacterium sp. 140616W15]AYN03768.1 hypothetical protein EAG11_05935 [Flavobacterium sp. 140616W15]
MSTKGNNILIGVIVIPLLLLVGWFFFESLTDKEIHKQVYLNHEIDTEYSGKIDSIYRLKMNHNTLTLKVSGHYFYVPPKWENKFKVDDSIYKKRRSLKVEHYREGKLLEILDYNNVVKNMK